MDEGKATGRDRITTESDQERALSIALQTSIEEQAGPGIFTGGKSIESTIFQDEHDGTRTLVLIFNDGGALRVNGMFSVDYAQPGTIDLRTGHDLQIGPPEPDVSSG